MAFATLSVDFVAKIASFEESMSRAGRSVASLENRFVTMGRTVSSALGALGVGLSVGGIAAVVKSTIDAQDALAKLSQKTGITVESLAGLEHAASLSGVEVDQLAKGVRSFSVLVNEAANGQKSYQDKLVSLGLNYKELKDLSPEEQFYKLADAVSKLGKEDRAAAVAAALGDRMSVLVPLLSGGADGMRELVKEGQRLNPVTEESARQAEAFNDNLERLKKEAALAGINLTNDLLPSLSDTAQGMADLAREGHGVLAMLRGFIGLGKLPFDLVIGDPFKIAGSAEERVKQLNKEISDLQVKLRTSESSGVMVRKIIGTPEEIRAQIQVLKNQIEATAKFADKLYPPKPSAPGGGGNGDAELACIASGGTWDGKKCRPKSGSPGKSIDKLDLFNDEMARNAKLFADETERIAGDLAFMRDVDLAQNNPIAAMQQEWVDAGRALKEQMLTPLEKFEQRLDYINELWRRGVIDVETYDRAIEAAFDDNAPKMEKVKSLAEELGLTFTSAFEDAIVSGEDFGDVLKGLEQDIARLLVRRTITEPLTNAIGSIDLGSIFSSFLPSANGNAFSGGGVQAFANGGILGPLGGLLTKPTLFPMANGGIGLGGEAGTEAVMPLMRMGNGKLGVYASGGGGNVQINIIESPGNGGKTERRQDGNGGNVLDIYVEQIKASIAGDISRGRGSIPQSMQSAYGLNRVAGAY